MKRRRVPAEFSVWLGRGRVVELFRFEEREGAMTGIEFRRAQTEAEFEAIHRLNHRIFAEEVGQHGRRADGRLVDRFHERNAYFIACRDGELVGMVSVHAGPEFSIASRLRDPESLQALRAPLEVRLLAVLPECREGAVVAGLFSQVDAYARRNRYSDLLISGIAKREGMYRKLGFQSMGPAVACGDAAFVPMRLSVDAPPEEFRRREQMYMARWRRRQTISLLPGPVEIAEPVARAFHRPPVSHRSRAFLEMYADTRARLSELMGGLECVILSGSGTLSNDTVAANLRAAFEDQPGLVISNGEFGERLMRHARRAGLRARVLRFGWGEPWQFAAVEQALDAGVRWVWAVHLETSTGVLNDLPRLLAVAEERGVAVAADCVSSMGAAHVHGAGEARCFLASGVSGKALGSYAGLAFVFVSVEAMERLEGSELPATFDLIEAVKTAGPVTTVSSPLVAAAHEALRLRFDGSAAADATLRDRERLGRWTRERLREAGLAPLCREEHAAAVVTTFVLPSTDFARRCARAGFRIAHESDYLQRRGWGQIATMGDVDQSRLEPLFAWMAAEGVRDVAMMATGR
jgi:aspartate aminotransferase-like enzyme